MNAPEYYFSVAQHGSGREYTLCNKAISKVGDNMANFWVRESCVQKFIANSHKLRIGSEFLPSPPHRSVCKYLKNPIVENLP